MLNPRPPQFLIPLRNYVQAFKLIVLALFVKNQLGPKAFSIDEF
jgi:hypothetical protein